MSEELKPCPFCGGEADIERAGDHRVSTVYQCLDCGCSLETGEEFNHGKQWNTRAPQNEWISVATPPENDTYVIAIFLSGDWDKVFYCDDGYWCRKYGLECLSEKITRWMPLPTPPKEI